MNIEETGYINKRLLSYLIKQMMDDEDNIQRNPNSPNFPAITVRDKNFVTIDEKVVNANKHRMLSLLIETSCKPVPTTIRSHRITGIRSFDPLTINLDFVNTNTFALTKTEFLRYNKSSYFDGLNLIYLQSIPEYVKLSLILNNYLKNQYIGLSGVFSDNIFYHSIKEDSTRRAEIISKFTKHPIIFDYFKVLLQIFTKINTYIDNLPINVLNDWGLKAYINLISNLNDLQRLILNRFNDINQNSSLDLERIFNMNSFRIISLKCMEVYKQFDVLIAIIDKNHKDDYGSVLSHLHLLLRILKLATDSFDSLLNFVYELDKWLTSNDMSIVIHNVNLQDKNIVNDLITNYIVKLTNFENKVFSLLPSLEDTLKPLVKLLKDNSDKLEYNIGKSLIELAQITLTDLSLYIKDKDFYKCINFEFEYNILREIEQNDEKDFSLSGVDTINLKENITSITTELLFNIAKELNLTEEQVLLFSKKSEDIESTSKDIILKTLSPENNNVISPINYINDNITKNIIELEKYFDDTLIAETNIKNLANIIHNETELGILDIEDVLSKKSEIWQPTNDWGSFSRYFDGTEDVGFKPKYKKHLLNVSLKSIDATYPTESHRMDILDLGAVRLDPSRVGSLQFVTSDDIITPRVLSELLNDKSRSKKERKIKANTRDGVVPPHLRGRFR